MGSRSGGKRERGLYYIGGGLTREIYEEQVNGVTVIRTRWKARKRKKRRNK